MHDMTMPVADWPIGKLILKGVEFNNQPTNWYGAADVLHCGWLLWGPGRDEKGPWNAPIPILTTKGEYYPPNDFTFRVRILMHRGASGEWQIHKKRLSELLKYLPVPRQYQRYVDVAEFMLGTFEAAVGL